MIDKVQKIKEWINKKQEGLMDTQGNFEYPEHKGAYHILCNLDAYIDSLQKEPKECMYSKDNYTDEDRKALCDGCEEKCKHNPNVLCWNEMSEENKVDFLYDLSHQKEEPISEDLIKELKKIVNIRESVSQGIPVIKIARHFVQWQKEKMMKEAINGFITEDMTGRHIVHSNDEVKTYFRYGTKVKIIIIKQ